MNSERAYDATTKNQRERKTIRRNQMAQRPTVTQMSRIYKDCLPNSEVVVFISISLPFLREFTCLNI